MSTTTQRTRRPVLKRVHFGEFLVENHAITDDQLLDSLADHWSQGGRLGDVLVRNGYIGRDDIERLAAQYEGVDVVYV
ncbi:MAG TPA: hypothetical protein VGQ83_40765 [Polyangia bacterium]|jgi:hypothetical protein